MSQEITDPSGTATGPQDQRALIKYAVAQLNKLSHPPGGCGGGSCCSGWRAVCAAQEALAKALEVMP